MIKSEKREKRKKNRLRWYGITGRGVFNLLRLKLERYRL